MPKSLFFLLSQLVTLQNTHTYTHTNHQNPPKHTHTHHQNPLNMLRDQIIPSTSRNGHDLDQNHEDDDHELIIRDIHALAPPLPPPPNLPRQREAWETSSHTSLGSTESENFTTMSREFNALVIAGNTLGSSENEGGSSSNNNNNSNLGRIGEEEMLEETNPLAIVADTNPMYPVASPSPGMGTVSVTNSNQGEVTVQRVKKEEVESKISAWQNAKIAKINNRFKREDAIINGWEGGHVQKSTSWMKKVERKLEEKRAKALEKMQNDIAKARRKAEERRATAEAKRGTKVARVLEIANLMRAVGRAPAKRSFF